MFINIVTPCTRPENLSKIEESLQTIPKENRRWIIVFDAENFPTYYPKNCELYCYKDINSTSGNAQRNLALGFITHGHIYFNDDDTIIYPTLWDEIKNLEEDFICFKQANKDGTLRLEGNNISVGNIDSHNFIVSTECAKDIKWLLNRYDADGVFASECYQKAKTKKYIPKILSVYNSLK